MVSPVIIFYMYVLNGSDEAGLLDKEIAQYVKRHDDKSKLIIVQIGSNPVSTKYVDLKIATCRSLGIISEAVKLESTVKVEDAERTVSELLSADEVAGGIIQLPLPDKDYELILKSIPAEKDIDVLNRPSSFFTAPVVRALDLFLAKTNFNLTGKKVCLLGGGYLVGIPIIEHLVNSGAELYLSDSDEVYTNLHKEYKSLRKAPYYTRGIPLKYDLIVSSIGVPMLINPKDITAGAFFVDFGSGWLNNSTQGDLDYSGDYTHLAGLSPSPGGMGPLVIRYLIMNLLRI